MAEKNWDDVKQSMEDFISKWNEASKEDFVEKPKSDGKNPTVSWLGMTKDDGDYAYPTDEELEYWKSVSGIDENPVVNVKETVPPKKEDVDPINMDDVVYTMLNEAKNDLTQVKTSKEVDKTSAGKKAHDLANIPNPVEEDSYGNDNVDKNGRIKVSDGLAASGLFDELNDLKKKIYQMESDVLGKTGFDGEKWKKAQGELNSLREKFEKISNKLSGNYETNQDV